MNKVIEDMKINLTRYADLSLLDDESYGAFHELKPFPRCWSFIKYLCLYFRFVVSNSEDRTIREGGEKKKKKFWWNFHQGKGAGSNFPLFSINFINSFFLASKWSNSSRNAKKNFSIFVTPFIFSIKCGGGVKTPLMEIPSIFFLFFFSTFP